jgi:hypothetical protein
VLVGIVRLAIRARARGARVAVPVGRAHGYPGSCETSHVSLALPAAWDPGGAREAVDGAADAIGGFAVVRADAAGASSGARGAAAALWFGDARP